MYFWTSPGDCQHGDMSTTLSMYCSWCIFRFRFLVDIGCRCNSTRISLMGVREVVVLMGLSSLCRF
jgi:hypothetical protein